MFEYELDYSGCLAAVLRNAFNQARLGAQRIEVEVRADGSLRVRDSGQGFPVHGHPFSQRPLLEVILQGPRRGPRNTLAQVSASALWLEVETSSGGRRYRQRYEFARPTAPLEELGPAPAPGTALTLAPATGGPPSFAALVDQVRELGRDLPQPTEVELSGPAGERESLRLGE